MSEAKASNSKRLIIVDTDVHHNYSDKSDLYPYMSRFNAERFADYGFGVSMGFAFNGGVNGRRADIIDLKNPPPADLGSTTTTVADCQNRLLNLYNIDIALLTGGPGPRCSAMPDADFGSAICRAFNDFSIEHWVEKDDRFRLGIHVNMNDPIGAAAEIDRLGNHPAVCAVMVGCGALRPYGNRMYHPIFEAIVRNNLAFAIHFSEEGTGINPPISAAGYPSYYIETRQLRPSYYVAHISSMIFEGLFEKFPTLKVGILEAGFAWLAPMMWKMDLDWKGLSYQTPWVKKLPSEYVRSHFRFATQPMEEPADPDALKHIVRWIDGENTLMFASDYPHWDWDDPTMTMTGFSDEFRRKLFSQNAIDTFNLTLPARSIAA